MAEMHLESGFGSYRALLRRRSAWIITIVPAALLLAVYIAYSLPAQYRSTATIIYERAAISGDLIRNTVNSADDQQIEIIQGRALTVGSLKDVVAEIDPYPNEAGMSDEAKAQRIIQDTSLERVDPVTFLPLEKSPAFSLHYQNPDPRIASEVATRLASLFLTYHQRVRVEAASAGARVLEGRARSLEKELQDLDVQFARLRSQHGGMLPNDPGRAEEARYRATQDLDNLERDLRSAREKESLLQVQLSATSPNLLAANGNLTDLATVRAQLADAEQRYTPDHPDVKRLRRALETLLAQGAGNAGATTANNPEYLRLSRQLSAAQSEVSALQVSVARARARVSQYDAELTPSTELARQVADLDRRRSSLQSEYQDVQGKLKAAQLGQQVETTESAFNERFSMIRAPYETSRPYKPNGIGILMLGLVLGGALAAIAVAIAESTDATVRGTRDLANFHEIPLLGSVHELLLPEEIRRRRLVWGSVSAIYLLAAVFVGLTVVRSGHQQTSAQPTPAVEAKPV